MAVLLLSCCVGDPALKTFCDHHVAADLLSRQVMPAFASSKLCYLDCPGLQGQLALCTGQSALAPGSLSLTKPSAAATADPITPETVHPLRPPLPGNTRGRKSGHHGPQPLYLSLPPPSPKAWLWSRPSNLTVATLSWWTNCWTHSLARCARLMMQFQLMFTNRVIAQ